MRTTVLSETVFENTQATLTISQDLERNSKYELTIDKVEAKDGSIMEEPYILRFSTSGGPSVVWVNIDTFGLPQTQTIVLTFDQTLNEAQEIADMVSTSGISAEISKSDNQVFIRYVNAPMCTDMNIYIKPGLLSNYGIVQDYSWSFSTRTICHTTSVIGYSVEGRPILAYTFGSGGQTILYTGSIHGNEFSAKYLMDEWVNELEKNGNSIPSDKKIIVVPNLNPDGLAVNRRNNSNNVDLNRNFDTADWQTDVLSPENQMEVGGGGVNPLSEPESQTIANFTIQLFPRLVLSFHGAAGYAIANQAGDSNALAELYAQLTGYSNMTGVSDAFGYPITGTYDNWMQEKYGIASLIIELSSNSDSEFNRNIEALWAMARS
jgi:hypothetical protein